MTQDEYYKKSLFFKRATLFMQIVSSFTGITSLIILLLKVL